MIQLELLKFGGSSEKLNSDSYIIEYKIIIINLYNVYDLNLTLFYSNDFSSYNNLFFCGLHFLP